MWKDTLAFCCLAMVIIGGPAACEVLRDRERTNCASAMKDRPAHEVERLCKRGLQ